MRKSLRRLLLACVAPLSLSTTAAAQHATETAVLAGGCFWGMEAVFEHVKGVRNVVSGYAGGTRADATYDKVSSERTRHAEAVRVEFDPRQVSYGQLLKIYFTVAHDPTQLNRQGPDTGTSYRSAIFPQSAQQKQIAKRVVDDVRTSGRFKRPIATRLESGGFDVAEAVHQDYVRKHPTSTYVIVNDLPKLAKLRSSYPQFWRG